MIEVKLNNGLTTLYKYDGVFELKTQDGEIKELLELEVLNDTDLTVEQTIFIDSISSHDRIYKIHIADTDCMVSKELVELLGITDYTIEDIIIPNQYINNEFMVTPNGYIIHEDEAIIVENLEYKEYWQADNIVQDLSEWYYYQTQDCIFYSDRLERYVSENDVNENLVYFLDYISDFAFDSECVFTEDTDNLRLIEDCYRHNGCYYEWYDNVPSDTLEGLEDYHGSEDFDITDNTDRAFRFGVEVEVNFENLEDGQRVIDNLMDLKDDNLLHIEYDGSLDDIGFEIISQPTYVNDTYQMDIIKSIFNTLDNSSTKYFNGCGQHIHIDRKVFNNKLAMAIFGYVLNHNLYNELSILSERKSCEYAHRTEKTLSQFIDGVYEYSDRYVLVNYTNTPTIEVRLFKGTANYGLFEKRLEFLQQVVVWSNVLVELLDANVITDDFLNTFEPSDILSTQMMEYIKDMQ